MQYCQNDTCRIERYMFLHDCNLIVLGDRSLGVTKSLKIFCCYRKFPSLESISVLSKIIWFAKYSTTTEMKSILSTSYAKSSTILKIIFDLQIINKNSLDARIQDKSMSISIVVKFD